MKAWRIQLYMALFALAALPLSTPAAGGAIKDTESATHGDEAASYQIVDTYNYPGFKVVQFNLSVLSHYSYLLISGDQILVIDPGRDVFAYLERAKQGGARIKGVFLTHSHADFVAGHTELAKAAGCPIYASASSGAAYPFQPLREGSTLTVGDALVKFIEAPGHTPDGLCAAVYSRNNPKSPEVVFTGDTLFVGSIGRPDLMGGTISAAALASMMYDTWTKKLAPLPDRTVIFPAHGAGSLCGAHLSDKPFSSLGAERASNVYLSHDKSRSDFIAAVLDGLPEAPPYFKHNATLNRKGPELVSWDAPLPAEVPADKSLTDPAQFTVVDLRSPEQYAVGHIPNAIHIGLRGRFESWVGTMIPWGTPLVLCGNSKELQEALYRLHRVGYHARGLTMEAWEKARLPVARNEMISPAALHQLMQKGEAPLIVDVRLPNEWMGLRIGTVVNLPLNHLGELASKLDPDQPVVTVCNSAYRSSMAVGILERKGFKGVSSLAGGSEAWIKAGLPVYGAEVKTPSAASSAPAAPRREIRLPERIAAPDLKRLLLDLPGTFQLVDIRPSGSFADYSLPGSENVDIADLLANPAYLTGAGPLIIVDRDGSLAMAAAGILSQKTQRPIKALHGGLAAYWEESELGHVVSEVGISGAAGPSSGTEKPGGAVEKGGAAPHPAPAAPQPPKTKSAGC